MLTIDQATAVMAKGVPVMFRGMHYLRIIGVSKVLTRHNDVVPSVTMEDRIGRTVYHGDPEEITMHGDVGDIHYYFVGDELKAERVAQ